MTDCIMLTTNCRESWTFIVTSAVFLSSCVSNSLNDEAGLSTINAPAVVPAQIKADECVRFVQLKRDSDYLCELANGSTRPLKPGERRSSPLTREEIDKVFSRNREDVESCIISVVGAGSQVAGKVFVKFEIELDGKVSAARYLNDRSTYKNEKLGNCIAETIKSWRFPLLPGEDTVEVTYPLEIIKAESSRESLPESSQDPSPEEEKN